MKEKGKKKAAATEQPAAMATEKPTEEPPVDSLDEQLLKACDKRERPNPERVADLLARGASARFVSDPGGVWGSCNTRTALHEALLAMGRQSTPEDKEAAEKVVRKLIDAGADVNAVKAEYDWRGCGRSSSAFDLLLERDANPGLLELFLAHGADPNKVQRSSRHSMRTDGHTSLTPLHCAVRRKDVHTAGVLLRAGADVEAVYESVYHNERGFNENRRQTALHLATEAGSKELVVLLLAEGANPNAVSQHLDQVPSGAVSPTDDPRDGEFVSSVICVPVKETALHIAIRKGQPSIVGALLALGANREAIRTRADQKQSADEMLKSEEVVANQSPQLGDELERALRTSAGWSPENHGFFSSELKQQIKAILLVAKAANWSLPDDALYGIFERLAAARASS